jgi:hypothetical protein
LSFRSFCILRERFGPGSAAAADSSGAPPAFDPAAATRFARFFPRTFSICSLARAAALEGFRSNAERSSAEIPGGGAAIGGERGGAAPGGFAAGFLAPGRRDAGAASAPPRSSSSESGSAAKSPPAASGMLPGARGLDWRAVRIVRGRLKRQLRAERSESEVRVDFKETGRLE